MARKSPKKKYKYQINKEKYDRQVQRIKKNYEDIERMGGEFSKTLAEIIKPIPKPTEATVRRLKQISKDDLYRLAKTRTGEPGWKIKQQKLREAQSKAYLTKIGKKYAFADDPTLPEKWITYTKKQQKQIIEEVWERRFEKYKESVERESEKYQEPEEPYQWIPPEQEPEPVEAEEPEIPETGYPDDSEPPYAGEDKTGSPDFGRSTGGDDAFYYAIEDHIDYLLNERQDSSFMRGLKNEFDEMRERMTPEEFRQWLEENQEDFIHTIEEVMKYEPTVTPTGTGLNSFTKAMNMMNEGITPLDKFYTQDDVYNEAEDEEDEEDSDYFDVLDTVSGEVLRARHESYLQKVDRWGHSHYATRLADESGLTLDPNHFIPISDIKDIEDYLK